MSDTTTEPRFDALEAELSAGGAEAVFERLADGLRIEKQYHELFDALLMRARHRLGLPVILNTSMDDLAEPVRTKLEDAYLEACREVGNLLLGERRFREAWMYLRPLGDRAAVAQALETVDPATDRLDEVIEIALHEGVAPALGYRLVLENYGTCNAITTFEGAMAGRSRADQQTAGAMLVRHLHRDLLANVKSDIARQEGSEPQANTLKELVGGRDYLFAENNYHIDTSHLNSVVRLARLLEEREPVALALDLTEYGRRLGRQFQFPGEEPFADVFPACGLWFAGILGQQVDEAVAHFGERARAIDAAEEGTLAAETYIALLARLGRYDEAIDATATLLPQGVRASGFAPNLLELSRLAGNYDRLMEVCRQRGDLIGYTAGLLEAKLQSA